MANSAIPSTTRRSAAYAGLALGLLIALAANLTYAVPRGPVVVGLGLVAPLVLPVVLYLRTTFTATGFWQRAIREAATLSVAGPAAAISFSPTYELILSVGEPVLLAVLAPLSSDGLAGMATLALHRMRQPAAVKVAPKSRAGRVTAPPAADLSGPQPKPSKTKLAPRDWAIENWPTTGGRIKVATGCSKGYAYRIAAELKAERAS